MDNLDKLLFSILFLYWFISSVYMINWHHKQGNLDIGTFLLSLMIGTAISPIVRNDMKKIERREEELSWNRFRTLAPPPPIPPPLRQTKKEKKDFKLLRGYDKVR